MADDATARGGPSDESRGLRSRLRRWLGGPTGRRSNAQLESIRQTIEALRDGDADARATVDERSGLGDLAVLLNGLADVIGAAHAELERQVRQRTEELKRVYEGASRIEKARSDFFAAVSHEFRTPLFAILGHAEMMLDEAFEPDDPAWRGEFATTIKASGEHLLRLVNSVLDMAKFDAGSADVELVPVSVAEAVAELSRTAVPLARRGRIDFSTDIADGLPHVRADPTRLQQILLNLTSNAIKYTAPGGRVEIAVSAGAGRVEVSVSDTGEGIPAEAASSIFEPFYQVAGAMGQEGQATSGLSLALTKRMVEAQGGSLWFTSDPGLGSTFTFSLVAHVEAEEPEGGA